MLVQSNLKLKRTRNYTRTNNIKTQLGRNLQRSIVLIPSKLILLFYFNS